eukprot:GHVU01110331.1.p1 GENE.GHVU01110331.1~~GHVU01110331.1.p1  ORF type:complete len:841 (+),score=41.90 GHVU01110331.1:624-3146(+)
MIEVPELVGVDDIDFLWEHIHQCERNEMFCDVYDVLRFLGQLRFETVETATKVLLRFMHDYDSPLGLHGPKPPNNHGDVRFRRVCNVRLRPGCKCTVTVVNKKERVDPQTREVHESGCISIQWNGVEHNHEFSHPRRMQRELVETVDEVLNESDSMGLSRLDASNRVNAALAEYGACKERRDISSRRMRAQSGQLDVLRRSESSQVQPAFAGVGIDQPIIPGSGEGERQRDYEDVMNALGWCQKNNPQAYINVAHENGVITYVFISLLEQRILGSLFGDFRCLDDRHDVSHHYMKLGINAVVTSHGTMHPAAVAFMSASDIHHWRAFVSDSIAAFETVGGRPVRNWKVCCADQDGSISGAVRGVDDSQRPLHIWTCFWHFVHALEHRFLRERQNWQPIVDIITNSLKTDSAEEFRDLMSQAREQINALRSTDLKDTMKLFLEEVEDGRCLATLDSFTNGYNSQSIVESASAVFRGLGTHSGKRLGDIVRCVVFHMMDQGAKYDKRARVPDRKPFRPVHIDAREQLTEHAFRKLFLPEYDQAANYLARWDPARGVYSVTARDFPNAPERLVTLHPSGDRSCDCNRSVWLGMPCRHTIAVSWSALGGWAFRVQDFNSRWLRNQPSANLRFKSPFSHGPGERVAMNIPAAVQPMQPPQEAPLPLPRYRNTLFSTQGSTSADAAIVQPQPTQVFVGRHDNTRNTSSPRGAGNDARHMTATVVQRLRGDPAKLNEFTSYVGAFMAREGIDPTQAVNGQIGRLPSSHPARGRPREGRLGTQGPAKRRRMTCSYCHQEGHARNRCKKQLRDLRQRVGSFMFACVYVVVCVHGYVGASLCAYMGTWLC